MSEDREAPGQVFESYREQNDKTRQKRRAQLSTKGRVGMLRKVRRE